MLLVIHLFIHSFIHSFHSSLYLSTVKSDRAWDRSDIARDRCRKSCFSSFHSLSYSSTVRWIELRIELGIDLRINNARRTVLARVSGLVHSGFTYWYFHCLENCCDTFVWLVFGILPLAFIADVLKLATLSFRFVIDAQIFRYKNFIAGRTFIKKCHLENEKKYCEFHCNRISTVR